MSSSDRILFLTGDKNFETDSSGVVEIPFRNKISLTNKLQLTSGSNNINSGTFEFAPYPYDSYYSETYAELNSLALRFKIPSKNMLIQVGQRSLSLDKKVFTSLSIGYSKALLTRPPIDSTTSLPQSRFIEYSESGIIEYLSCIPKEYYINKISRIVISSDIRIPAGDLYLHFFQF